MLLKQTYKIISILVLPIVFTLSGCGGSSSGGVSQSSINTGSLYGRLLTKTAGRTVESATETVTVPVTSAIVACGSRNGTSDTQGYFEVTGIPAGTVNCTIRKTGYETIQFTSTVIANQRVEVGLSRLMTPSNSSCDQITTFCIDALAVNESATGSVGVTLKMKNIPSNGINAGVLTITWDSSKLAFVSSTVNPSIGKSVIGEKSTTPGTYRLVFSNGAESDTIISDTDIAQLKFSTVSGATGKIDLKWVTESTNTNFSDYSGRVFNGSEIAIKDGYVNLLSKIIASI